MDEDLSPETGSPEKTDIALELDFQPNWARKPPENPYVGRSDMPQESRGRHGGNRRDDRRGRPDDRRSGTRSRDGRFGGGERRGERGHSGSRPGGGGSRPPRREGDRRGPRHDDRGHDRRPPRPAGPPLDVRISFMPDRERLALVVQDIQASRRAYPLIDIARRFLGREDLYLVKLELPAGEGGKKEIFAQCLECKRVFRSRSAAEAHVLQDHLEKFFDVEETEVEPPKGTYSCVARCRLSGELLGPSNYHGYNERIQELWSSRFAHMTKAEYLSKIETVRDEALVEQWKASLSKQTVYRLKEVPEGEEAEAWTCAQARDWMRQKKVNALIRESARCIVPGPLSRQFDDAPLRQAMSRAWQKESRFPLTLSLALRPAFRHMHLHLFKVNVKETYVTAVLPAPADRENAPEVVRELLAYLDDHSGCTRQELLNALREGKDAESPEAAELLLHLGNLVANGGVMEFHNGKLFLPKAGGRNAGKKKEAPAGKTDESGETVPAEAGTAAAEPGEPEDAAAAVGEEPLPEEPPVQEISDSAENIDSETEDNPAVPPEDAPEVKPQAAESPKPE